MKTLLGYLNNLINTSMLLSETSKKNIKKEAQQDLSYVVDANVQSPDTATRASYTCASQTANIKFPNRKINKYTNPSSKIKGLIINTIKIKVYRYTI
jgi:hypothetical protein